MVKEIETNCTNCGDEISHELIAKFSTIGEKGDEIIKSDFMIISCRGCLVVSFLLRDYLKTRSLVPKIIDNKFPNESEFKFLNDEEQVYLPMTIFNLYQEVSSAFVVESPVMASVGLRMLIESICINKKIVGNNLMGKIKELRVKGLICDIEYEILDKLRLIGNESAHKIKEHSIEKLGYGLEVVNHVLKTMYILPKVSSRLKK